MTIPLITSYTEFQQRLGYCKLLLAVSKRAASQPEQVLRQLDHIFFKPTADGRDTYLGQILGKQVQVKTAHSHLRLHNSLAETDTTTSLRSFGNEAKEILTLCKALGLVDDRVVILENAMPLIRLIPEASWDLVRQGLRPDEYNPLILDHGTGNVSEKTYFLIRLISEDIAFTLLPLALHSKTRTAFHRYIDWDGLKTDDFPPNNMLTVVYEDLICGAKPRLFGEVRNAKNLDNYILGDPRKRRTHPGMRQYARFRHQATPRLEFLKELGIIAPQPLPPPDSHLSKPYSYLLTPTTEAYVEYIQKTLLSDGLDSEEFVRNHAFKFASIIYHRITRQPVDQEEVFRYFLRAYVRLKRDMGNTPSGSICVLGCLLAQDDGLLIEINEMHQVGRDYARKYSEFLRYSGGSIQLGDYLISVDHRLLQNLGILNP